MKQHSRANSDPQVLANTAAELIERLRDVIELLNEMGCVTALEVWHCDGLESTILDRLNGEFVIRVGAYRAIVGGD